MHTDTDGRDQQQPNAANAQRNGDTDAVIAAMLALANSRKPHLHAWIGVDLSMAQLRALLVVAHQQQIERPVAVRDVADSLGVTLSTASHLIERLVRAEMVTRHGDPGDRRRTLLQPTAAATTLLNSLRADSAAHMRHWLQHLEPADLAALATGMRALQVVVEQHTHTHTHPRDDASNHDESLPGPTSGHTPVIAASTAPEGA